MTILPERLQDVLAAMRSASTQCAEFAGRIEAATALQPSVGGVVSDGKFGAFYVCPTCTGTGVVSEHLASPAQADGWRPIDEAPRDGSPVWVRGWDYGKPDTQRHYGWVYWSGTEWNWEGPDSGNYATYLTDWNAAAPSAPRGLGVE